MLLSILSLVGNEDSGLTRFEEYVKRAQSFSVQTTVTSQSMPMEGKGLLLVQRPGSFRFSVKWGPEDYTYVKSPEGSVEYQAMSATYQEYAKEPGLVITESDFVGIQQDAVPQMLLTGSFKSFMPGGTT